MILSHCAGSISSGGVRTITRDVVDQNVQSAPAFFELGKNASDAVNIAQITAERQAISAEHLLRPRKVLRVDELMATRAPSCRKALATARPIPCWRL